MKPTKNRFFCKDCGRRKMVFETEKKADTFIKFNGDEIEGETGYKPERSYFCIYCGGWHVTSKKEYIEIKSKTEKVLDLYEQEKEKKALVKAEKLLITAKKQDDLKKCLDSLKKNISVLEHSKEISENYTKTLDDAFNDLEKVKNIKTVFKGSGKIKKELEEKLTILRDKVYNKE